jgi:Aspartate-ammonia ligase
LLPVTGCDFSRKASQNFPAHHRDISRQSLDFLKRIGGISVARQCPNSFILPLDKIDSESVGEMMSTMMTMDKKADLAGPGIGNYEELAKVLPDDYHSLLEPKHTQEAITLVKRYIEENLCRELNLIRVEVPLIVDVESGVND